MRTTATVILSFKTNTREATKKCEKPEKINRATQKTATTTQEKKRNETTNKRRERHQQQRR